MQNEKNLTLIPILAPVYYAFTSSWIFWKEIKKYFFVMWLEFIVKWLVIIVVVAIKYRNVIKGWKRLRKITSFNKQIGILMSVYQHWKKYLGQSAFKDINSYFNTYNGLKNYFLKISLQYSKRKLNHWFLLACLLKNLTLVKVQNEQISVLAEKTNFTIC